MSPEDSQSYRIRYEIVPYTRGKVLELGPGPWKTYPHFIGVDLMGHVPCDARDLSIFAGQSMDAVFSSYLLNEFEEKEQAKALREWWRVIKPGGYLVLYLPHKTVRNEYPGEGVDDEQLVSSMKQVGYWDLCAVVFRDGEPGESFLHVYRKISHGWKTSYCNPPPLKACAVVRFGGAGDMIQTASILPELKEQGYHITLFTSEGGYEVIKNDPNVDRFVVQQRDQVPNQELGAFFQFLKEKYDRLVQLSESVEGTFLAMPGRTVHAWPHGARHKVTNFNYLEIMHDIAEVPYIPHPRFYPTRDEEKWAHKERKRHSGRVILWVLSGSSVHKAWPYMDHIIARILLEYPDVRIYLCGDPLSQLLEAGWENEKRVVKTCGKWSMRQSLVFAEHADLVIGPETGVLNAVSNVKLPGKIVFLSHSSITNLTRDWLNTASLVPDDCACYPCHMMQHGFTYCSRDEATGVAECQAKISPEKTWAAITSFLKE